MKSTLSNETWQPQKCTSPIRTLAFVLLDVEKGRERRTHCRGHRTEWTHWDKKDAIYAASTHELFTPTAAQNTRWQTKSHSTAPSALSSSQLRVRIIRDHMQYYTLLLVEFYLVRK